MRRLEHRGRLIGPLISLGALTAWDMAGLRDLVAPHLRAYISGLMITTLAVTTALAFVGYLLDRAGTRWAAHVRRDIEEVSARAYQSGWSARDARDRGRPTLRVATQRRQ